MRRLPASTFLPQEPSVPCITPVSCPRLALRGGSGKKGVIVVGGSIRNKAAVLVHHLKCTSSDGPLCGARVSFESGGFRTGANAGRLRGRGGVMSQQQFVPEHFRSFSALLSPPSIYLHTFPIFNQKKKKLGQRGRIMRRLSFPFCCAVCCHSNS